MDCSAGGMRGCLYLCQRSAFFIQRESLEITYNSPDAFRCIPEYRCLFHLGNDSNKVHLHLRSRFILPIARVCIRKGERRRILPSARL